MNHDLRIVLYFALEGEQAPEGPGWYLMATRPGEAGAGAAPDQVVPRVRLSNAEVGKLGKLFDKFIENKPLNYDARMGRADISVAQAVDEAIASGGVAVRQQLAQAEAALQKLNLLRARADEFAPPEAPDGTKE